ncbi:MAG: hypothetical protein ACO3O1_10335 [Ilumatobacteraceae bacterium]|jgi:hypothetical protein
MRHDAKTRTSALRYLVRANDGDGINWSQAKRDLGICRPTLQRWWKEAQAGNVASIEPEPATSSGTTELNPVAMLDSPRASDVWAALFVQIDRDITEARNFGSMGSVPACRKLQIDLYERVRAARAEEGSSVTMTAEEVEANIRRMVRQVSPRHAAVIVEELAARRLA